MKVDVYCGWYRATIVNLEPKLLDIDIFEIPCIECGGTGKCNYVEEIGESDCIPCKGTGKQYV